MMSNKAPGVYVTLKPPHERKEFRDIMDDSALTGDEKANRLLKRHLVSKAGCAYLKRTFDAINFEERLKNDS